MVEIGDDRSEASIRDVDPGTDEDRTAIEAARTEAAVSLSGVSVNFGSHRVLHDVTIDFRRNRVTALLGPSGCGKTTLLRSINRLHDDSGGEVTGTIMVGDLDVYARGTAPESVRTRVGMVFQRPNPFPTMSIFDNAVAGLRMNGIRSKRILKDAAEAALHHAALWDIVKDRLNTPAVRLSGGQQQRLCIARALAVEPEVLLMDEPCSSLDPIATAKIEELIKRLSEDVTIVLVTHNLFQAKRVSDDTAVFMLGPDRATGELVEHGSTNEIFESPKDPRTRAYVSGEVG